MRHPVMLRALAVSSLALACHSALAVEVDSSVLAATRAGERVDALIVMADQSRPLLAPLSAQADYRVHRRALVDALRARAELQQADVRNWLQLRGIDHRPYWITNAIWARLSAADVAQLSARGDIARIAANPSIPLRLPERSTAGDAPTAPQAVEWGVDRIGAPLVWAEGFTGQDVVIAGQDTGYQWDHPALKAQYRGWNGASADHDYNWHDAIHFGGDSSCDNDSQVPCDGHGHGTHTAGTFAGDDGGANQIGVAPGAHWIGCRNMTPAGDGTPATYFECMQWFLAPTDLAGQNPDPDLAPDIINNSWGCPPSEGCTVGDELADAVGNLVAAGILFVASAGNDGSGCSCIFDPPAIYDASFVVGSTNSSDAMSGFSSRGPVSGSALIRPDVSAPGSSIRSSVPGGGYGSMSGTSMAGPHVAGAAALLMSVNPALKGQPDQVAQILRDTAVPVAGISQSCGGITAGNWPNHVAGYGRIDAYAAAVAAQGSPVSVDVGFEPASVVVNQPSQLVFTLSNGAAGPAQLTAPLMNTLPGLLRAVDPLQAATTCPDGTVTVDGEFWTVSVNSGTVIPASGSCTVSVQVSAPAADVYEVTVEAGALQTDIGANQAAASAALEVTEDDTLFVDGFDGAPVR